MKHKFNPYILLAVLSFVLWGLFPMYFKLLNQVNPFEIILHRIIWSFVLMCVVILLSTHWQDAVIILTQKKIMIRLLLSSLLISMNWLLFVYGVSNNKVLETSLGYFISPLITIFFGILFLKEKVSLIKKISIIVTFLVLFFKIILTQNLSFVSVGVALSFSLYSLIKKTINANSIVLFFVETFVLVFPSLIIWGLMLYRDTSIVSATDFSLKLGVFLLGLGVITSVPLLLFNYAVRHVELNIMGFIQYITPTMTFLTAIFLYREPLVLIDFFMFVVIWVAVFMVSIENSRETDGT